jgi:ribulose 1,5-bisphosphate synthetase/thiazole synthase
LKHRSSLFGVLGLVVDRTHTALLMSKALLDPIAVEAVIGVDAAGLNTASNAICGLLCDCAI